MFIGARTLLLLAGLLGGMVFRLAANEPLPVPPSGQPASYLIASPEADWPQWRGPRRDGVCNEIGLLKEWPPEGPPRDWKVAGLGRGYTAPIISQGRLFTTGDIGDALVITALDLQGRVLWQATNGAAWKGPYPGARGSCVISEGRLFHLNAHGRLVGLEAASGRELWVENVLERFDGRNITWGLSECLLVDGPRVIVTVGGSQALMVALAVRTGEAVWASEPLKLGESPGPAMERVASPAGEADRPGYASPILVHLAGRRQIVSCSLRHAFGVDADSGRLLWTRPLPTRYAVIAATPVLIDDGVFVTAPDGHGGALYRVAAAADGLKVETAWRTPLDTCQGGLVSAAGRLYGSWYRDRRGWAALDARTGELLYDTKELAKGAVLLAEGRLYCLSEEGELALIEPGADAFHFRGRFRVVTAKVNDCWTHPVIHQRKLYLRYHGDLFCHSIAADGSIDSRPGLAEK